MGVGSFAIVRAAIAFFLLLSVVTVEAQPRGASPTSDSADLRAARAVVERYWSLSPEAAYELLSTDYKDRLRKGRGITTAKGYGVAMSDPERVWRKQTYQRETMVRSGAIRITVLADWEQEGYEGVMTFIFDLVKSSESWKIANIMH
ncbi:MAG: hypothetical protein ACREAL_05070 [Nitrosopumilaceae archaeon]